MSNGKCNEVDCAYPDCDCWERKFSQSIYRIRDLEQELGREKKLAYNDGYLTGQKRIQELERSVKFWKEACFVFIENE